jgi:hypothetical protein
MAEMACKAPKEPTLYGFPKYEVESLADNLERAETVQSTKPGLHEAAMKLIAERHAALGRLVGRGIKKQRANNG